MVWTAVFKKNQKRWITGYVFLVVFLLGIYNFELKDTFNIKIFAEDKQQVELIIDRLSKESDGSTNSKCQKKHNILFAKEPKCAGTTVTNILLRFADSNNLSVIVPRGPTFGTVNLLDQMDKQYRTPNNKYNMICHYWPFRENIAKTLMYKDTVYITVIREPVARFASNYYYNNEVRFKVKNILPVEQFVQELQRKYNGTEIPQNRGSTFGFKIPATNLSEYLKTLNSIFHFVMITEFLDESLILLKDELCWSMSDIVYVRANVSPRTRNETKLSNQSHMFLTQYLKNKNIVYRYFLERFQEKVKLFGGERMKKEVANLRSQCSYWKDYCISNGKTYKPILTEEGKKHPFCNELVFSKGKDALKRKQGKLLKSGYKFPS